MKHLFTLPAECRPAHELVVGGDYVHLSGVVVIRTDGTVWAEVTEHICGPGRCMHYPAGDWDPGQ